MFLIGELMDLALEGMHYYHTYDRPMLQTSISLCYLGWMLLLTSYLVKVRQRSGPVVVPDQFLGSDPVMCPSESLRSWSECRVWADEGQERVW